MEIKYGLIIFDLDDTILFKDNSNLDKIKEMLQKIRKNNYLVLFSNSSKKNLDHKLLKNDLARYFDSIYSRSFFVNRKPFPFKYRKILSEFENVDKDRIYCVGDKFITDILGAKLIGLKSVLVRENLSKADQLVLKIISPNYIMNSVLHIPSILGGYYRNSGKDK